MYTLLSVTDWWAALTTFQQFFWGTAIVSSVFFLFFFVISLFGFDPDSDVDADGGTDFSADAEFPLLSIRGIVAFFTFFGWAGVVMLSYGFSAVMVAGTALVAGLIAMFIVGWLLFMFLRFQESGNFQIEDAMFSKGTVYLTVPPGRDKAGKVHLLVNGRLIQLSAFNGTNKTIPTGTKVRVTDLAGSNIVVVEPLDDGLPPAGSVEMEQF